MYNPKSQFSNTSNLRYDKNFVADDGKLAQNYESGDSNWYSEGVVQFRPNNHQESMESGVNSPPLWKNSPSPPKSPSYPLLSHHHNYRGLSPNSRTQAIARGQWELMEMVKNMPESSYELSLKDLVEHHRVETLDPQAEDKNINRNLHQRGVVVKEKRKKDSKKNDKNLMRRESFENKGLFLNMVFPFSWKSKKNKRFSSNTSGKVSPKPEGVKGGGEKDWWKKKFTGSSDSDSSRTSNNSGSSGSTGSSGGGSSSGGSCSGGRKKNGFVSGCWLCFKSRKSKSVVD